MPPTLKALAKRSKTIHGVYKLLRDRRTIPAHRWREFGKLTSILRVLPNTMLPFPRLFDVYDSVLEVDRAGVEGDIVECGVWNGGCIGLMGLAHLSNSDRPRRRIHLFDSFAGLPQPSANDLEVAPTFLEQHPDRLLDDSTKGELIAIGACVGEAEEQVASFLSKNLKIPRELTVFHAGWFQDTVPIADDISRIAILRLDGDWYESTRVCINGFYDRVSRGGYVIIDDYGAFSGCRKAIDEFIKERDLSPRIVYSDKDCVYFRKL